MQANQRLIYIEEIFLIYGQFNKRTQLKQYDIITKFNIPLRFHIQKYAICLLNIKNVM